MSWKLPVCNCHLFKLACPQGSFMIDLSLFKRQLSQHLKTDSRAYKALHVLLDAGTEKSPNLKLFFPRKIIFPQKAPNLGLGPSTWSCRDSGSSHVVSRPIAIQTEEEWAITAGWIWWARLWRGHSLPLTCRWQAMPNHRGGWET